jgi:cysteine-rich repeat protein
MMTDHWPRIMVYGGTTATALAALFAACVTDGTTTVKCSTGLECASNWMCTEAGDVCYPESCGDGIYDRRKGEFCDDGNAINGDGCSGHCLVLDHCGDGVVDVGEACDDGNTVSGDGCNTRCRSDEKCLNSVVDPAEQCDEGMETATCNDDCTLPRCGDGNFNPLFINPLTNLREGCDEGMSTATCDADCSMPDCGDGLHNAAVGEQCDDGLYNAKDGGCLPTCTLAMCGDGEIWKGVEECGEVSGQGNAEDPGDTMDCDADCTKPACGDGHWNEAAGEECDDGNTSVNDACPSGPEGTCQLARCGDEFLHVGVEGCEPALAPTGSPINSDSCDRDCTFPACGDGIHNLAATEACDDGNRLNIDACLDGLDGHCRLATCGDGFVHLGVEQCDDGNADTSDVCPSECRLARCGDGFILTNFEECDVDIACANQNEACDQTTCQCA